MGLLDELLQRQQLGAHDGKIGIRIIGVADRAGIDFRVEIVGPGRGAALFAEHGQQRIGGPLGSGPGAGALKDPEGALVLAEENAVGDEKLTEKGVDGHDGFFVHL